MVKRTDWKGKALRLEGEVAVLRERLANAERELAKLRLERSYALAETVTPRDFHVPYATSPRAARHEPLDLSDGEEELRELDLIMLRAEVVAEEPGIVFLRYLDESGWRMLYQRAVLATHPDRGGKAEDSMAVTAAWKKVQKRLQGGSP